MLIETILLLVVTLTPPLIEVIENLPPPTEEDLRARLRRQQERCKQGHPRACVQAAGTQGRLETHEPTDPAEPQ